MFVDFHEEISVCIFSFYKFIRYIEFWLPNIMGVVIQRTAVAAVLLSLLMEMVHSMLMALRVLSRR